MDEYEKNTNFKHYVDAFCNKHKISIAEALTYRMVKDVEEYYKNIRETRVEVK